MSAAAARGGRAEGNRLLAVGMTLTATGFALAAVGTSVFVGRHHPTGAALYGMAALVAFPIVCMLAVMGMYLEQERDEFQRAMAVRSLLWAIGGTLGLGAFVGYLRAYGGGVELPGFSEFVVFWAMFCLAQWIQRRRNKVAEFD